MHTDYDEILRALALFHRPGAVIEIRHRYSKGDKERVYGQRFNDPEQAANYAAEVSQRPNTIAVWSQLNPIKAGAKIDNTVRDEHIDHYAWLLADVEAVRPKDTNATEAELTAARGEVAKIEAYLQAKGFRSPIVIMSGNGWHLRYPIDVPASSDLIPRVLEAIAKLVNPAIATVDTSVGNPGRVAKLPGTAARKAEATPERPHRMARLVTVPEAIEVTPTAVLEAVAVPAAPAEAKTDVDPFDAAMTPDVLDVPDFLTANDWPSRFHTKPDGTKVWEIPCPRKPNARTGGGACILQKDGVTSGDCKHESCRDLTLPDILRLIDPHYRERGKLPTPKTVKDAEYQARRFLETCPPAYVYRGEVWFYSGGIWQKAEPEDLRNGVCRSLMRVYREYAKWLQSSKKKGQVPSITETAITNVLRCVRSILPSIPKTWEMPVWIDGKPARVLVVENGILDLATNELRKHTPRLFAQFKLPYCFDAAATCPLFNTTLKSIFDDPAEIDLLQEVFGATIVGGNDRRAIWLWQGATHGGKGLLARILCLLLGTGNWIAIRAGSFGGQFALWNARSKLLIIVPDINGKKALPGPFVESAKIISGGDPIDVDGKNKASVCEVLPAKLLLVSNDLLQMQDDSGALFNRFRCLKFRHHFFPPGHKLHETGRPQDERLEAKLATELPGILNWALAGLRRVDERGFTIPAASAQLQEALETEGAPVQTFACEYLTKGESAPVDEVYATYAIWCEEQKLEPLDVRHFGTALHAALPTVERKREPSGKRRYRYHGVRLKTKDELEKTTV
jgi:putative DNA primase/helicase